MKRYNELAKNILIVIGFVVLIISIILLQKEIVEKIFIVSPFMILWLSFMREKANQKRTTKKDEIEKQKDIQYFFKNFIEWIDGGLERSSYLENFVLRKFNKYEKYFGISILDVNKLSPDEREGYKFYSKESGRYLIYKIFVLEGKYILEYIVEYESPLDMDISINFVKPHTYKDDYEERIKKKKETKMKMINDIIEHVRKEHNIQLDYNIKELRFG